MENLPPVDLRGNLAQAEAMGELVRVKKEVEPLQGIPAIMKAAGRGQRMPMLLFENIKGAPGTRAVAGFRAHNDRVLGMLGFSPDPIQSKLEFMAAMKNPVAPVLVPSAQAPVHENVIKGPLRVEKYIAPTQGALGLDRFYYQPLCVTRHPVTRELNVGLYRSCIQEDGRLTVNARWEQHGGLHIKAAMEKGEPIEVAMVLGVDLADYIAGETKIPTNYDEWSFSGAIRRRPTPVVKCVTLDLEVPANAEIVIEGVIKPPFDRGVDGPWPEYLNYLGGEGNPCMMEVTALTFRNNPINQVSIAGTIPELISIGTQVSFFRHMKAFAGDFVVDTNMAPTSGGHHGIVKVRKSEPEHEGMHFNVGLAAFGLVHRMDRVTLVDDDINIYNMDDVDWAITTRCNPTHQVHILGEGLSHHNNPIAGVRKMFSEPLAKGKMIIDATIPWKYRTVKKPGGIPYFFLTQWPDVDLREVFEPEDFKRWAARGPLATQGPNVMK